MSLAMLGERSLAVVLLVYVAATSCSQKARTSSVDASALPVDLAAPRITVLVPDTLTVRVGEISELRIRGRGFDADSNTVMIGSLVLHGLRANESGTEIRFIVPDRITSAGEAPPRLWDSGSYPVSVLTRTGKSAAMPLFIQGS